MNSILIISPWVRMGGAETLLINLAYNLKKKGTSVAIFCLYIDNVDLPIIYKELKYILPYKGLDRLCKNYRWFRASFGMIIFFVMGVWIGRKYDVINPHNPPSHWVAVLCKILYDKMVVWTCNEPPEKIGFSMKSIVDYIAGIGLDNKLDKFLVKKIDKIIVLDRKNKTRIINRYGREDAIVVNSGIDFEFFSRKINIESTLIKTKIPQKKFVLLMVGTLAKSKNQLLAIESLEIIRKSIPNACLIICGDGPEKQNLKKYVQDKKLEENVIFTGKINNEELRAIYKICDVVIVPAVNQSWGLTPLEALSCNKLSIVSSGVGISELLEEHNIGFISSPNKIDFSNMILNFYDFKENNTDQYILMIERGIELIKNNFTWEKYAEQYLEIIKQSTLWKR